MVTCGHKGCLFSCLVAGLDRCGQRCEYGNGRPAERWRVKGGSKPRGGNFANLAQLVFALSMAFKQTFLLRSQRLLLLITRRPSTAQAGASAGLLHDMCLPLLRHLLNHFRDFRGELWHWVSSNGMVPYKGNHGSFPPSRPFFFRHSS